MKRSTIKFNLKGLEELKKQAGDMYVTRVGILGDKANRTDKDTNLNNAEIGFIQMFGSFTHKIPPRDFLLFPLQKNRREFMKAIGRSMIKAAIVAKDWKKVFQLIGKVAEEFVDQAFATSGFGQWPPNSPVTIARKGSDKPLIDTGQLRRAITSDVVAKGQTHNAPAVKGS
jgi:phage gpG-like protein